MSKIFRGIGLLALLVAFLGGCVDETPGGESDLGDTNQPLMEDMGEVFDDCELGDVCWEDGEVW